MQAFLSSTVSAVMNGINANINARCKHECKHKCIKLKPNRRLLHAKSMDGSPKGGCMASNKAIVFPLVMAKMSRLG
jgi:hypothetical protein